MEKNRIIMHESIMVIRIASRNSIVIQLLITPFLITQIEPLMSPYTIIIAKKNALTLFIQRDIHKRIQILQ